nr:hypothetical protein [Microbacterium sp. NIBRBAC000506063]
MTFGDLATTGTGMNIAHVADAARTRLQAQAADLGGPSPLVMFRDTPESGIDISRAHPGSIPQFITGKSTLLSNLFRDEVGRRTARLAAERITAKQSELRTIRGIDAVHLAVGLASWRIGGADFSAPVLLRPSRSDATTPISSSSCRDPSRSTVSSCGWSPSTSGS